MMERVSNESTEPIEYGEFEASNDLLNHIPALRSRLAEKGYLFFREILDTAALRQIRRDMLVLASRHGIVDPSTPLEEGVFSGKRDLPLTQKFETSRLYREMLELQSFNAFGRSPLMMLLFSGLLEDEVLEHRRRIARITFPQSYHQTTPPHQDHFYIRGTRETYTCWIPTGDCPPELGGLAVLEGSNQLGFLEHQPMSGTGGHGIPDEISKPYGLRWLTTSYKPGDLLFFHGLTIHRALHNTTEKQLRISLEYRMQRRRDPIDPGSTEYHMKGAFGENESLY